MEKLTGKENIRILLETSISEIMWGTKNMGMGLIFSKTEIDMKDFLCMMSDQVLGSTRLKMGNTLRESGNKTKQKVLGSSSTGMEDILKVSGRTTKKVEKVSCMTKKGIRPGKCG